MFILRLILEGDLIIQEANEIEHGDNLVLLPREQQGRRTRDKYSLKGFFKDLKDRKEQQ